MSTAREERYVDLKKICDQKAPELFDLLSWILLLNLDLVHKDAFNLTKPIEDMKGSDDSIENLILRD